MTRMHRTSCWWLTCGVVALTVTLSAAAAPAVPSHNPLELTSQGADASSSSRSASSRPRKLLQDTSTTTSSSSSSSSSGPCVGSPQQPVPPQQQGQPSSVNTPALAGAAAAGPSPATDPSTTGKVLPGIGDPPGETRLSQPCPAVLSHTSSFGRPACLFHVEYFHALLIKACVVLHPHARPAHVC
jgi:hypothetical protein